MKKIILFAAIIACLNSFSQNVAINTTGNGANASAMLDVSASNKGILIPRMTSADRQNIANPANGLLVFDITTNSFWYFSTAWKEMINAGGGNGFSLPYSGANSSFANLFSINNTNTSAGSTAVYGKSGTTGSNMALGLSSGVWGENSVGTGVTGTSNSGSGVLGISNLNHGIYGLTGAAGFAGIYGNANGMYSYGVMGEAGNFYTAGIYGKSTTIGKSAFFETTDPSNADTTVLVRTNGTGPGLNIELNNSNSISNALSLINKGHGSGIYAQSDFGMAGFFKKINNNNFSDVVTVENNALSGAGILVNMKNGSGGGSGLYINHLGQGHGISINVSSPANEQNLIQGYSTGAGGGIAINLANVISAGDALNVHTEGTGYSISASSKKSTVERIYGYPGNNSDIFSLQNDGNGASVDLFQSNPSNSHIALRSYTSGNGDAIAGLTEGTGAALSGTSFGTGPGLLINNISSSAVTSLATFQKGGGNKARIDGTGKGFFNGGTQNSGADLAEVFDVTGNIQEYEMGDVLVISVDKDRTVEKSSGAYSTLVAGVYATKPGVLLTEENIDTDISGKVPMGVVGVIPTKVCLEGGEIKRGDLLVTSSIPGVAMKADPDKVKPGQVIGKALENFDSNSIGKIKVLVSVK